MFITHGSFKGWSAVELSVFEAQKKREKRMTVEYGWLWRRWDRR